MRLSQKRESIQRVNLQEIFEEIIQTEEQTILEKNKSQLQQGKTSENQKITPEYTEQYAKKKGFRTPDLYLTGDFYSGFILQEQSGNFNFGSDDFKQPFLIDRYGIEIFGLTDRNMAEFISRKFYPQMMQKIRRYV